MRYILLIWDWYHDDYARCRWSDGDGVDGDGRWGMGMVMMEMMVGMEMELDPRSSLPGNHNNGHIVISCSASAATDPKKFSDILDGWDGELVDGMEMGIRTMGMG